MAERLGGLARMARGTGKAAVPVAAVMAALGLAALALAGGVALASPALGVAVAEPPGLAALVAALPWVAALLGIAAAGLALASRPGVLPAAETRGAAGGATLGATVAGGEAADMQAAVRELRATIQAECRELATTRQAFGGAAHEAMLVGARLSGVALDAEARLAAAVTGAEDALRHPEGVLARAGAASTWLERALPELASLVDAVRRGAPANEAWAGADARDPAGQEAVGGEIDGQITALETVADRLRRDTAALVAAGYEIAAAGAGVLARIGKVAGQADAALEALPSATAAAGEAADQAATRLTEAAERYAEMTSADLPELRAALVEGLAGSLSGRLAERVGAQLGAAADQAATRLTEAAERYAEMTSADLPELRAALVEDLAGSLSGRLAERVGAQLGAAADQAATRLAEAAARYAEATSADLPELRAALVEDLAGSLSARLAERVGAQLGAAADQAATRLAEAAARYAEATSADLPELRAALVEDLAGSLSARLAEQVGAQLGQAAARLAHEAQALRGELAAAGATAARDLAAAAAQSNARLAEAATQLPAGMPEAAGEAAQRKAHWEAQAETRAAPDAIRAEIREAMRGAVEDMARDAARVVSEQLGEQAGAALRTLAEAGVASALRLDELAARAEGGLQGLGTLLVQADRLEGVAALLRDAGETLAETGQALTVTGADLTSRMDVSGERIVASLRTVDGIALAETVTDRLASAMGGALERAVVQACAQPLHMLAEASAVLCADSAGLDAAGRDAMAALQREAEFLLVAGQAMAANGAGVVARLSEAAALVSSAGIEAEARASGVAAAVATLPRVTVELAETAVSLRLVAMDLDTARPDAARLAVVGEDLAQAACQAASALRAVPVLTVDLTQAATRLQDDAQALGQAARSMRDGGTETALRLAMAAALAPGSDVPGAVPLPLSEHLDRLETLVARLQAVPPPAASPDAAMSAEMAGEDPSHGRIAGALDAALARHDASTRAVIDAMARVEAAAEAVRLAAPNSADWVVTTAGASGLAATLRHLGGVERETAVLLGQAEALAEAVLGGQASPLPPELARRMPDLLAGVETTIGRLRSVATALALACDGPGARILARPAG